MKRKDFIRTSSILGFGSLVANKSVAKLLSINSFGFKKSPKITFLILEGGVRKQDIMDIVPTLPTSVGVKSYHIITKELSHTANSANFNNAYFTKWGEIKSDQSIVASTFKNETSLKQIDDLRSNKGLNNIIIKSTNTDIAHSSLKEYKRALTSYNSWIQSMLLKPRKAEMIVVVSLLGRNLKPNSVNDGTGGGYDHSDENSRIQSALVIAPSRLLTLLPAEGLLSSMDDLLQALK